MKTRLPLVISGFFILHSVFGAPAPAPRPDLIVVISIDQFRYDDLERFGPWFSERGFNRFLKSGANFTNAYYRHAKTFTGPGHASIALPALAADSARSTRRCPRRSSPRTSHRVPCAPVLPITGARQTVLAIALAQLENGRRLRLVVPASATADVRSAAAALRDVVTDAPELPAGYARLDALDVSGDKATVRLWTGPIPKPQPGVLSMNCGTGHLFNLTRDTNGAWRITSRGIAQC